jgi:recombinational DNA repair ATPase RecF
MVEFGSKVAWRRLDWFSKALPRIKKALEQIAPQQAEVDLQIRTKWMDFFEGKDNKFNNLNPIHFARQGTTPSIELLEHQFDEQLSKFRRVELQSRSALVGPHRDDWQFTLAGQPLSKHGSQGEVRSVLLALKISEVSLFNETRGHLPLFLLDDFSSELDEARRKFLLGFLESSGLQVFVTTTDANISTGRRFEIADGICREFVN